MAPPIKRVDFPNSLWKCVSCSGKLQPVYLEKHGEGPGAVIFCHCQRCKRVLGRTTESEVQCLYSHRVKPAQGELFEMSFRGGLVLLPVAKDRFSDEIID
jgi:hypothetical protein